MSGEIGLSTVDTVVEVSEAGADWQAVPGAFGYEESGGEAPTNEQVTFGGVVSTTGKPRKPSVSFQGVAHPHHPAWELIRSAFVNSTNLWVRVTTKAKMVFAREGAGNTVAISAAGEVTFVGDKPNLLDESFGIGQVIKIGANNHTIIAINEATGKATVVAPPAAVAATQNYSIIIPSLRRGGYAAEVTLADRASLSAESSIQQTVNLTPIGSVLPAWEVVNG